MWPQLNMMEVSFPESKRKPFCKHPQQQAAARLSAGIKEMHSLFVASSCSRLCSCHLYTLSLLNCTLAYGMATSKGKTKRERKSQGPQDVEDVHPFTAGYAMGDSSLLDRSDCQVFLINFMTLSKSCNISHITLLFEKCKIVPISQVCCEVEQVNTCKLWRTAIMEVYRLIRSLRWIL